MRCGLTGPQSNRGAMIKEHICFILLLQACWITWQSPTSLLIQKRGHRFKNWLSSLVCASERNNWGEKEQLIELANQLHGREIQECKAEVADSPTCGMDSSCSTLPFRSSLTMEQTSSEKCREFFVKTLGENLYSKCIPL